MICFILTFHPVSHTTVYLKSIPAKNSVKEYLLWAYCGSTWPNYKVSSVFVWYYTNKIHTSGLKPHDWSLSLVRDPNWVEPISELITTMHNFKCQHFIVTLPFTGFTHVTGFHQCSFYFSSHLLGHHLQNTWCTPRRMDHCWCADSRVSASVRQLFICMCVDDIVGRRQSSEPAGAV